MKEKNLKVAFVDDEKRIYPINQAKNEEISKAIKELVEELDKRLRE